MSKNDAVSRLMEELVPSLEIDRLLAEAKALDLRVRVAVQASQDLLGDVNKHINKLRELPCQVTK